jgi:hypothetical protein
MWSAKQVAKLRGRWAGEPERRPKTHVHRSRSARAQALADPAFLASAAGESWIGALAENFPHTRYWAGSLRLLVAQSLNALAAKIIDARYEGNEIEEMEAEFRPPNLRPDLVSRGGAAIALQPREAGLDDDAMPSTPFAMRGRNAAERDDSSVADLFASYDRCELLFRFSAERWLDDALVFSHRPWPETSELAITANLQFALNNLGYTIGEFRKASGNRHPADRALPRHARRRRAPIISHEQLAEIIDNACSTSFLFCLYAIVPIPDLIALDLSRPSLSRNAGWRRWTRSTAPSSTCRPMGR